MDKSNPYASPRSEITPPTPEGIDTTNPFDPSGRFTRLSYLAWGMITTVVVYILIGILMATSLVDMSSFDGTDPFAAYKSVPLLIVQIAAMVVFFLFAIRRLHDWGSSGWWSLLILVPIANIVLGLMLIFKAGNEGANRFAPPRPTPDWERIVGIIAAVLIGLMIVLALIGITTALFVAGQQPPVQ